MACFVVTIALASDWKLNPVMFNTSGVPSLTFSQPRFADMDADGDMDLILGSSDDKPLYLSNTGTISSPKFSIIDDIFVNISEADAEMAVAHDIDADGDLDLICGGFYGLQLYLNTGNAVSASFTKQVDFFAGLSIGSNPIVDMGDIDADGDLDMVIGFSESGEVRVYTNSGSNTNASFSESAVQTLGDIGLYAYPVFCDPDNDNDLDVLCGKDGYGMVFYENAGSDSIPLWVANNGNFSAMGLTTYFNSPDMVDLDNDGLLDVVYGNYTGPLKFYENAGSSSSPNYTENTSFFGGNIDVGSASTPWIIDFDGDGDLDMLTGISLGDVRLYRNNGTSTTANFVKSSTYNALKHSIYPSVSFADVTNNGYKDAIVGDLSGNIYFHSQDESGFKWPKNALTVGNVGSWSTPRFVDMDHDQDFDIVAGNEDGYLTYYENQGTSTQPLWSEITNYFDSLYIGRTCSPAFADLDFDGDYDMLLGTGFHEIRYFENQQGQWVEDTTMVEGLVGGQNASPAFGDIDGDGDQDLILGAYDGTFTYYENMREVVAIQSTDPLPSSYELRTYPNPFNPTTEISFQLTSPGFVELSIFDLSGKKVKTLTNEYYTAGMYNFHFMASQEMGSGIYICRLMVNAQLAESQKITLVK